MKSSILTPSTALVLTLFGAVAGTAQERTTSQIAAEAQLRAEMPELHIAWNPALEIPRRIAGIRSRPLELTPQAVSAQFVDRFAALYRIEDPESEIRAGELSTDERDFSRMSLFQSHRGVPVYGSELRVVLDPERRLRSILGRWQPGLDVDPTPRLDPDQAVAAIAGFLRQRDPRPEAARGELRLEPDRSRLVIFDTGTFGGERGNFRLAYHVVIRFLVFFVDARTGEVLHFYSNVQTARDRETYNSDSCLDLPGELILNEAGPVAGPADAQTQNVHDFMGDSYDYFSATHGRDGHHDTGATITSTVHSGVGDILTMLICCLLGLDCCECSQTNAAYWPPPVDQWIFGDGGEVDEGTFLPLGDAQDVVVHEFAHGVTTYSIFDAGGDPVGLAYSGESGALNESYSDFFAAMVDRADWLIAEDVTVGFPAGALRDMANPPAGGQPDHMDNFISGGDVHENSGIPNKVAYLIADGGVHPHSGISVSGIGKDATELIYYHTLTHNLTETSSFLEAREATLESTAELYPFDVAKYMSVWNGFVACGICDPGVPGDCEPYSPLEARDPVDIAVVLDYSGSMEDPAEPGGRDKIEVLHDAVEIFLETWEIFSMPDDRVEIIYFETDVDPLVFSLGDLQGNVDALVAQVRGHPTGGYTAMGGGLRIALDGLSGGASNPAVVLFTNGIQNVNPMAVKVGPDYQIINSAGAWGGTSNVPENPGVTLGSYGIPVHIIGIGEAAATSYHTLLSEIADETDGLLHVTAEPDTDLRRFYLEDLVEALNLGTLEMVDYRYRDLLPGASYSEDFAVGGGLTRAAFAVHWIDRPGTAPPSVRVHGPSGTQLEPTRWVGGSRDFYRMAVFDFPYLVDGQPLDYQGTWHLVVNNTGNQPLAYQATLLVDETVIHYDFGLAQHFQWTGEPLLVTAQLTEAGAALRDVISASAVVAYPATPLGTLLATRAAEPQPDRTDLHSTPAYSKLLALLEDPAFRRLLEPRVATIDLVDDGSGVFRAEIDGTEVPGLYRIDVTLEGNTTGGARITRRQTLSAIVGVKPDPEATETVAEWTDKRADGSGTALITLVPFDRFGNYLGPDYGGEIELEAAGVTVTRVHDPLDGSYELTVEVADRAADPPTAIEIRGITVFDAPLSKAFRVQERFGLSLHLGTAVPHGRLDALLDRDESYGLDLEYVLRPRLSFEALFGYHRFEAASGAHNQIRNLSANLKFYLSSRRYRGFVNGGAGAYETDGDSSAVLGLNAGGGVSWQFRPRLYLEGSYNYHYVFTHGGDSRFSTLHAGLRWRF